LNDAAEPAEGWEEEWYSGPSAQARDGRDRMELLRVTAAWAAFAVFHSLTVSNGYERRARRFLGDPAYAAYHRLIFTAYSCLAFLALVLSLRALPDGPLYRLTGIIRIFFHGVQIMGAALLFWTPWDLLEFVGIRQWIRHRRGEPAGGDQLGPLFTGNAYGLVRHPLYLGISVILAFRPEQTRNSAVSVAMIILYFYVGSFFEERRMLETYGEEYRAYQERVPRFLPLRLRR
jgi:methanethiol S-methyltransferase